MKSKILLQKSVSKANFFFAIACCSLLAPLHAVNYTWTGAASAVSTTTGNWTPSGNPAVTDNVVISTSTPNTTNIPSGNWSRQGAGTTTISNTGIVNLKTGSARFINYGAFNMQGGQFNQTGEYFISGNGGVGTVTHSDGTIASNVSRGWFISDGTAGVGSSYILSGGTLTVTSQASYNPTLSKDRGLRSVWLGKSNDNASDADVAGDVFKITSGSASFSRNAANGTADLLISRNASLLIQGGTTSFNNYSEIRVGYGYGGVDPNLGTTATGAKGCNISISAGSLSITGTTPLILGFADKGTLAISGGSLSVQDNIMLGRTSGGIGSVVMTAGSLSVNEIQFVTPGSTFVFAGGTIDLNGNQTDLINESWFDKTFAPGEVIASYDDDTDKTHIEVVGGTATPANYSHYRFTPVKLRDDLVSGGVQLSEFIFLSGGVAVDLSAVNVTNPGGSNPATETPDKLIDGNPATKWVDTYKNPLIFDFGTPTIIDGFRFITGNDSPDRDPLRWALEGSNDGENWTILHQTTNDFITPSSRKATTVDILLSDSPPANELVWTGLESADWDVSTANWTDSAATVWNNALYGHARFDSSATPENINLTEPIVARFLEFTESGYQLKGDTLTLTGVSQLFVSASAEISANIAGNVGLLKTGAATLTLSGTNTHTGVTRIREGTLIYSDDSSKSSSGSLTIGGTGTKGVLILSSTGAVVFDDEPVIGNGADSAGAVRQTMGAANLCSLSKYLVIGNDKNAYGSYELSGGTMSLTALSGTRIGYNGTAVGVFTQTGGDFTCNRFFAVGSGTGDGTSVGVATFTGGTAVVNASYRMIAGDRVGAEGVGGFGIINIGTAAGGNALVNPLRTGAVDGAVTIGSEGTGYLNLNSGLLKLSARIFRSGGSGYVNLNGATLMAGVNNVELINNSPTRVAMFNGGLTVDTNNFDASISSYITTALGHGVYIPGGSLTVSNGGSGYIGAPLVNITSTGTGVGAMAVANVSNGMITSVTLTCPGQDYEEGDTLTLSFRGGGFDTAAPAMEYTLTAADIAANNIGGLTKIGNGNLTLSNSNQYFGPTRVLAGTLTAGLLDETTITVAAGATLAGNLDTLGPVVIEGTLSPGISVGSATGSSSLVFSGDSAYAMQISDWTGVPSTGYDTASFDSVATSATAGAPFKVAIDGRDIVNFDNSARSFILVSANSTPTGFTADNWQVTTTNFPGLGTWSVNVIANDLVLSYQPPASGYATWIANFVGLSDTALEADPDNDGISNLMEYVLNGSPLESSSSILPAAAIIGPDFVFSFVRRSGSKNDTTQTFQYGTELNSWTNVVIPAATAGNVTIETDTPAVGSEKVTVTLPTNSAPGGRLFGRLVVTKP